ncbi:MAG: ribosomal protein S12 methylthiotransferase RimO [Clostridiales bacterium GWB2_37_7]|nr:MAG: ribosomal protein S12 methylthiotransferase RimO [Clostridiales bacterium GWB2_37_7]
MSYKVALVSLGCSKNLVDSEVMLNILSSNSYKLTRNTNIADVIIVNTCGFIESAKQESIDSIIELGQLKNTGSCKVLIASGCLAERYHDDLMREIPELDAVIGTGDYKNILEVIESALTGNKVVKYGNQENVDIHELPRIISATTASTYLKIAEGCDNRCTYCIIPKLRGKYRSRNFEDIIKEANQLAAQGIKELNIIAQDTTRYGMDLYGKYRIAELLDELSKIERIEWIRLLYSYPDEFDDELIDVMANNDKVCKYLDIPIQHASDKILKRMGRRTTKEEIKELVNKLRSKIPNIALRTTLIVGFPGETEEDYKELVDFVKEIRFDRLGVFTYSREEDTPAYQMEEQVEQDVKLKRQERIMLLQSDISMDNNQKMVERMLKVLIEGKEGKKYFGRSYKDAPEIDGNVFFSSDEKHNPGEFTYVKIIEAAEYDLIGEEINEYSK